MRTYSITTLIECKAYSNREFPTGAPWFAKKRNDVGHHVSVPSALPKQELSGATLQISLSYFDHSISLLDSL